MTFDDYLQEINRLAAAANISTTGEDWPEPIEWMNDYTSGFTPQEALDLQQEAAELAKG